LIYWRPLRLVGPSRAPSAPTLNRVTALKQSFLDPSGLCQNYRPIANLRSLFSL